MKVVGKYLEYRYGYSSPRYSVRTTMLSLYSLKISNVFIYKISITLLKILICLGKSILNPIQKYKKQLNK